MLYPEKPRFMTSNLRMKSVKHSRQYSENCYGSFPLTVLKCGLEREPFLHGTCHLKEGIAEEHDLVVRLLYLRSAGPPFEYRRTWNEQPSR